MPGNPSLPAAAPAGPHHLLFCYGTLRRGQPYHHLLGDCTFVRLARSRPCYTLYDCGEYPSLGASGATAIVGELYRVAADTLASLDRYEGHPGYFRRAPIQLDDGTDALCYFGPDTSTITIASGDWLDR